MNNAKKTLVANTVLILVIIAGIVWVCSRFVHPGGVEYTDNAQVKQHITPVNTRVQGFIREICFEEYQQVHKGDTLVIIEDSEYRLRVAQAEADWQSALVSKEAMYTTINTTELNIAVTDAGIPQDNSAGNFVKVEQRIPVKIVFTGENRPEDMERLRAGMNVECSVKL